MEELKENINPFAINGYLSRKWYIILGFGIALVNIMFMITCCKSIFIQIAELAKLNANYSIYGLLTSGTIPREELIAYLIMYGIASILSFINNKKRISDIFGHDKFSYIISAIFTTLTVATAFANSISIIYTILLLITIASSFFVVFAPGKLSITNNPETETTNEIEVKKVTSFWKRWIAYIIDATFILGGLSAIIASTVPDSIFKIGNFSILFGVILTLLYFGIMNSQICKGQTLGKSLMGIKVVNKFGNYLTLKQSLIRTFILIICVTLPNMFLMTIPHYNIPYPENVIFTATFVFGTLFNFLFLFNAKTRQTLHDLALGSFVINKNHNGPVLNTKTNNIPVIFAILISLIIGMPVIASNIKDIQELKNPNSAVSKENKKIELIEEKLNINITRTTTVKLKDKTMYNVYVFSTDINDENLARTIWNEIKTNSEKNTSVIIRLHRTVNLGNIVSPQERIYKFDEK